MNNDRTPTYVETITNSYEAPVSLKVAALALEELRLNSTPSDKTIEEFKEAHGSESADMYRRLGAVVCDGKEFTTIDFTDEMYDEADQDKQYQEIMRPIIYIPRGNMTEAEVKEKQVQVTRANLLLSMTRIAIKHSEAASSTPKQLKKAATPVSPELGLKLSNVA